jgi:hypothetical protein
MRVLQRETQFEEETNHKRSPRPVHGHCVYVSCLAVVIGLLAALSWVLFQTTREKLQESYCWDHCSSLSHDWEEDGAYLGIHPPLDLYVHSLGATVGLLICDFRVPGCTRRRSTRTIRGWAAWRCANAAAAASVIAVL